MNLLPFLSLGLAMGAGAFIISTAKISAPFRVWLVQRTRETRPYHKQWKWLFDLVSCPFCVSVWLGFGASAWYQPFLVHLWWPLDWLVTSLALTPVAMFGTWMIRRAVNP